MSSTNKYMIAAALAGVASVGMVGCKSESDELNEGTIAYAKKIHMLDKIDSDFIFKLIFEKHCLKAIMKYRTVVVQLISQLDRI